MESTGITPVMNVGNPGYGYGDGFGFGGGSGIWLFAILALMWGGNGFFGGNRGGCGFRDATAEDVSSGFNFAELQQGNRDIVGAIGRATYDNISVAKGVQENILREIGEVKIAQGQALATANECCCATLRAIDGVNYNGALNTASINSNTVAQTQKILDALAADKAERQAQRIAQLEQQIALQGVVRYPCSSAYNAGPNPFCGCGCNGNI